MSPFQLNFQNAFIQEWSADVQRQIGNTWLIDIGYVGTRGLHLVQETDPNQPLNMTDVERRVGSRPSLHPGGVSSGQLPCADSLSRQFRLHAVRGKFHLPRPAGQGRAAILQGALHPGLLHVLEVDRHRIRSLQRFTQCQLPAELL